MQFNQENSFIALYNESIIYATSIDTDTLNVNNINISNNLSVDNIIEYTSNHGVIIDSVLLNI